MSCITWYTSRLKIDYPYYLSIEASLLLIVMVFDNANEDNAKGISIEYVT